jgi:hypothetical protein
VADRVLHDLRTVVDATAATFHGRASPIEERELEGGSERGVDCRRLRVVSSLERLL